MLRWVSVDELLAQLDEIQFRFEKAEWLANKKNLGAEENTMRTVLGQPRYPRLATNQLTSEAPVVTEYHTTYSDENYNDFFGFNDTSSENCYRVFPKTHDNVDPSISHRVAAALDTYGKENGIKECKKEQWGSKDFVECNGNSGRANYAYVTGTDTAVQSDAFQDLRGGQAACIDAL